MKKLSLALSLVILLATMLALPSWAVFPKTDGSDVFALFQGYYDNHLAWFCGFETNDIKMATSPLFFDFLRNDELPPQLRDYHMPQFAPKLTSALKEDPVTHLAAARPMYVVRNFQQGAVLSTRPGNSDYSGLWQIFYVDWLPGSTPRPITNSAPAGTDPHGLPSDTEATVTPTKVVYSCPVIAIGTLKTITQYGAPGQPIPDREYVIPQAISFIRQGLNPKLVELPTYIAWYENPITKATWSASALLITDTSDTVLAKQIGANVAEGLLNVPETDTQTFWTFLGPQPPYQRPIMSAGPSTRSGYSDFRDLNTFFDYSPVMIWSQLQRNIPASTMVGSKSYLLQLLDNNKLTVADDSNRLLGHVSFIVDFRVVQQIYYGLY